MGIQPLWADCRRFLSGINKLGPMLRDIKKIIYFLILIPLFSFGQNENKWSDIQEVTFYDLTKSSTHCGAENIGVIPSDAAHVKVKTNEWKEVLLKTTTEGFDVINEDCYLLVVKFKGNIIVPFIFHPKQKAIMDFRKDHFLVLFFPKDIHEKVDTLFKKCIDCIKDPKCKKTR